jgi:hypothetical protein
MKSGYEKPQGDEEEEVYYEGKSEGKNKRKRRRRDGVPRGLINGEF